MKRYFFIFLFLTNTAYAQTLENFAFEQSSINDTCSISLNAKDGVVREASIDFKNLADQTLSNNEIKLGANKIWINEMSWTGMQNAKNNIWTIEEINPTTSQKVIQETFQVEDKLKVFVTTSTGNSRAILDLMIRIVPSKKDNKKLDFYFVAAKNSKKSLNDIFKEKFADNVDKIKNDKSYCFKINYSSNRKNELSAELWGVKTLSLQE